MSWRAAILARGRLISLDDSLPVPSSAPPVAESFHEHPMPLKEMVAETERRAILHALQENGWNRTKAADQLGISLRQLFDKIQQYGLQP